jgi:acetyl-CoA C-acetyltransferase
MTAADDRAPVLAGIGVATQREDDPARSVGPVALMVAAARQAGVDCGAPGLLASVGRIAVPKGRWSHSNPARVVARDIGAEAAVTVLAEVGVLQQSLIADACRAIAGGEVSAALVVGGDAGHRILRSRIAGLKPPPREDVGPPDVRLKAAEELLHEAELAAGLRMPVGQYAIIDSAFRARRGRSLQAHRAEIGRIYGCFSEIAAANPQAWNRRAHPAEAIAQASERNPIQAFPYTKLMCTSWNVDQAAALLFCSAGAARAAGVAEDRMVHPWASSESNFMAPVSARAEMGACPGARIAGRAALDPFGLRAGDLDLVELYSCFPVAVLSYAEEIGLDTARDLTVTGGMPFAGGPFNNYVLQATARMAALLRDGPARTGLVSSVSGLMTKQGFGLWSNRAAPGGFRFADVSDAAAAATPLRPVVCGHQGPGRVAGWTVLHDGARPPTAIIVADIEGGSRAVASSDDPALAARLEAEEFSGAVVVIHGERFAAA